MLTNDELADWEAEAQGDYSEVPPNTVIALHTQRIPLLVGELRAERTRTETLLAALWNMGETAHPGEPWEFCEASTCVEARALAASVEEPK